MEELSPSTNCEKNLKLESYRWVIITLFGLYCGVNFFQFLQFTIIANIIERYYGVGSTMTDATGLIFMVTFIMFFIPIGHYIEKNSLRKIALISAGLTALGNCLKLFAIPPDRFYLILISQSMCGIAQIFMINIPPKVANIWFGADEVSIACAIGVMGCEIGLAFGSLIPTLLVPDSQHNEVVSEGLGTLFTLNSVISISVFICIALFFRSKPHTPPSYSQAVLNLEEDREKLNYLQVFSGLMKNNDYRIILFCFGISFGIWNSTGIFINEMFLHYFPNCGQRLGVIVLSAIISGGVFGSLGFGYILDKTHEFKKVSFFVFTLNFITWIAAVVAMNSRSILATYILIPLNGFFGCSLMVIGLEFAIETTYPVPEAYGTALLNTTIYLFAIFFVLFIEFIFKTLGFLVGQMIIAFFFAITAIGILFISSDFKRCEANILMRNSKNYGSLTEQTLEQNEH